MKGAPLRITIIAAALLVPHFQFSLQRYVLWLTNVCVAESYLERSSFVIDFLSFDLLVITSSADASHCTKRAHVTGPQSQTTWLPLSLYGHSCAARLQQCRYSSAQTAHTIVVVAGTERSCVFCNVLGSNNPNTRVMYQDEQVFALPDIKPAARKHLLVLPKSHIPNVNHLTAADAPLVRHMLAVGQHLLLQDVAAPSEPQQQDVIVHGPAASSSQVQPAQLKFGFHIPPFRSIDHLHLHCFQLPHKWYRWGQYQSSINWITADQLLDKLARTPSQPLLCHQHQQHREDGMR